MRILPIAAGAALFAAAVLGGCDTPPPPPPPHVVLYMVDTFRADHVGAYGSVGAGTPALDRFAREGVLFRRAYTTSSWTRPAVGSLLTGLLPSRHGAIRRDSRLDPDVQTLAEVLQGAGYRTAAFVTNPNVLPVFGFGKGFDRFEDVDAVRAITRADRVNEAVFSYLDEAPEGPQFLYVHVMDPHFPYDPPPPFDARYAPGGAPAASDSAAEVAHSRDAYGGEIAFLDGQFARLLSRLQERGTDRNTLVIVVSDHGEEFRDHGGLAHGKTLYQEQLRVPFAVRWTDGGIAPGLVERPVQLVDLVPTICELAGVPAPAGLDGRSLAPLLRGDADDVAGDELLYTELDLDRFVVGSVIRGDYKLIDRVLPEKRKGKSLYDLAADPGERVDLFASRPEVAAELEGALAVIRSGLAAGVFVELVGTERDRGERRVTGRLEVDDGVVAHVEPADLEEADRIERADDGRAITFDCELRNRNDPAVLSGKRQTDVDRVRFTLDPSGAPFRLELTMDGEPLPARRIVVGEGGIGDKARAGYRADDPELARDAAVVGRPGEHPDGVPFVRVYAVARPVGKAVAIDPAVRERLRALGYLDGPGD